MPRYKKIYSLIWSDEDFCALGEGDKLIALYVLTSEQSNRIGIFRFSKAEAAEALSIGPETFAERFDRVCQTLGWGFDSRSRVVYIPSWWKWNPPENVNNLKGNLKDMEELPQTNLLQEFISNTGHFQTYLIETFKERCRNVTGTLPERMATQEQEQEHKHEQEQGAPGKVSNLDRSKDESETPERKAAREEARKKSEARSFATSWLSANRPDLLRKHHSLAELIVFVGDMGLAIEESQRAMEEKKRDPFAYTLARLQARASDAGENQKYKPAVKSGPRTVRL